jgi:seryl-tRNA synthetase
MLDIRVIRQDPKRVKEAMRNRNKQMDSVIDEICRLDEERRLLISSADELKAHQNKVSREIPKIKASGSDVSELMSEMRGIADEVKDMNARLALLEQSQAELAMGIPNIPNQSVPVGADETANLEIRRWGTPTQFSYEPKAHWDIGSDLGILDPERAAKVTGARFHFYRGLGARMERSIVNYFLDTHTSNGYTEIFPPFVANRTSMTGTGQLPKFEEDMFKLDGLDYFLIPTAEVPVTNLHRDEIIMGEALPIKYCAYSACFRAEAGSAGRDTRGLIRQHQFNKVELVKFSDPDSSYDELEGLTRDAESVLQGLGLPYRVVVLCTGDLGFASAKTYDIEVWMPSYNRYVEISSCSNFEDFQSRRMACRTKRDRTDKTRLVHTLNGSGVAVGRTVAAILENYQNADGSVSIPKALLPYMGVDKIERTQP